MEAKGTMMSEHDNEKLGPLSAGVDERRKDLESQSHIDSRSLDGSEEVSPIKGLGWLDRLLALWILLAMVVGILLGNFVDSVGPALHQGEFVGVSVPIGE